MEEEDYGKQIRFAEAPNFTTEQKKRVSLAGLPSPLSQGG